MIMVKKVMKPDNSTATEKFESYLEINKLAGMMDNTS